ncbi:DUF2293 domain-containing protein [Methylorubrum rhodesianum]|jgi:hypothetical protein|uniref:DUF2293 domain-containing protein n=1 Tax=Methylorubrum rhodesianum TaxID=29427 RepID=A0ABU9ZDS9_9HYPH|nr:MULTISPECIES: DUF2293 domain-containing protein [Methylorubrum]MBI1688118.1 DUF2293 domain-containing protein [Methylorubrum sp. DB1722]MBK3406322.1 DUF2293 domain-containing protein [Methylorubrum rhodesianum]MBY0143184.1 DUF2293 domain-containing protein [Methylorubrum populi]MRI56762.1 DUF2293 domain-containing protein [Methylobacterium sp. DB1607]
MKKGVSPDRPAGVAPLADRRTLVTEALMRLAPRLPEFEAEAVVDRALRSPGLRGAVPENAAWLALTAFARHAFTEYDDLLDEGYDRDSARHFVLDDMNAMLAEWGCRRRVSEEADADLGEDDLPDV